jgi:glycosyltransferase involved in cell wall biosynthesis
MNEEPFFSVVIPVYNGGLHFQQCLQSLKQSTCRDWELIVVDDGSTDRSNVVAREHGARLFCTGKRLGPAAARNAGAKIAKGRYLFFIDADCAVHPDTLAKAAEVFRTGPGLEALFGSYDDAPVAPNFVAQYKNLFHHYVHQQGQAEASTFWTGCGAIKRHMFMKLGGFDTHLYERPSIEDIDLGYRLKQAGGRIRLAKEVQVKHLKAWTLPSLLKSDIFDRGIPWTRLILRDKAFVSDLNLQTHNRISVIAVYLLLLSLPVSLYNSWTLWLTIVLAGLLIWLNFDLYRFFARKRGILFALSVIPLHWLYYIYNAIAFGCGLMLHWYARYKAEFSPPPRPLSEAGRLDARRRDTDGEVGRKRIRF